MSALRIKILVQVILAVMKLLQITFTSILCPVHSYDFYHIHIMLFSSYKGYKLNSHLRASHLYHGGQRFESCWSLRIFFGLYLELLKLLQSCKDYFH